MKRCPKCGKEYGDDMLFCAECGEKLEEEQIRFCRNCGEKIRAGAAKCPKCGADLGVKKAETKKKKMPKAAVALAGGAVVLAAAAFAATGLLKTKKPSEIADVFYYEKNDGDWYYYNADKNETGKAGSGVKPIVSEDGKKLFYTDGRTLMYRDLEKESESEIVIDTNVIEYATDAKGSQVIYLKEDGGVYRNQLKKNNREHLLDFGEDEYFFASEDMEKLLLLHSDLSLDVDSNEPGIFVWGTGQFSVYDLKNSRKERIPLDDIEHVFGWNSDFTRMYLEDRDGKVYLYRDGNIEKVSDDFEHFPHARNYYGKQTAEKTLADLVENDLTNDEMQQNVEKQQLWQEINDYDEELPIYTIYYLDGTKEKIVAEAYDEWYRSAEKADIFEVLTYDGPEKVIKLSELDSFDELRRAILKYVKWTWIEKGQVKEKEKFSDDDDILAYDYYISENGKYIAYVAYRDDKAAIYLRDMKKSGSDIQVASGGRYEVGAPSDQGTLFYRDYKEDDTETKLYIGGTTKKIDDSYKGSFEYTNKGDILALFDSEDGCLLGRTDGNEIKEIDVNVSMMSAREDEGYIRFIR